MFAHYYVMSLLNNPFQFQSFKVTFQNRCFQWDLIIVLLINSLFQPNRINYYMDT